MRWTTEQASNSEVKGHMGGETHPAEQFVGGLLGTIGKGAASALGGMAVTGLFSLLGGGDSSEAIQSALKSMSRQLASIDQGISRLHADLQRVHDDLRRIDRDIVNEARKSRMQVVAKEIERAERTINEKFDHLQLLTSLDPRDQPAAVAKLTADILEGDRIEDCLRVLWSGIVGVEGAEGALQLLGDYYAADIQPEGDHGLGLSACRAHLRRAARSLFTHRVAIQIKGILLLTNAFTVDPSTVGTASREARINQARDQFFQQLTVQCDAFCHVARALSIFNWPYEFFYYRDDGRPGVSYPQDYLTRSITARSDRFRDAMLNGQGVVVVRIYVSHCAGLGITREMERVERDAVQRVTAALFEAIRTHLPGRSWWRGKDFPEPFVVTDLTDLPPFPARMRDLMVIQTTAHLIEHRLAAPGIDPERPYFLGDYLRTIQANVPDSVRTRRDGRPLFSPALDGVGFPLDERGYLTGSINLATYHALEVGRA